MVYHKSTKNSTLYHTAQEKLSTTHYTNDTAAHQRISPNITTRLSHFLSSDPLLTNKIHPALGNQWLILCNMSRTHRETDLKIYLRVINHGQRKPWQTEATVSGNSCWKCNTYINQVRIKYRWTNPPAIWTNWKLFWHYWEISSETIHRDQIHTGGLPLRLKQSHNTTQEQNRTLHTE